MEKNIYDLLNQVETETDEYEVCQLTQDEKNKILNNDLLKHKLLKEKEKMSNRNKQFKIKVLATVASLALVLTASFGSVSAFATTNPIAHSIADILGINNNLESYATMVNQSETNGGITAALGEVVYDRENNKFIVSTSLTIEDGIVEDGTYWAPYLDLYINGQWINAAKQGSQKNIDENTVEFVSVIMLKEKFEGDMDINVKISGAQVNSEQIKEHWSFKFTTNGDELSQNTSTYEIGLPVEVGNGESFVVETLTINPVSTSIFYSTEYMLFDNSFKVIGVDNLGNAVTFHSASIREGGYGGEFLIDNSEYTLTEQVQSFTLKVYANHINPDVPGEFVAISEEFVVNIK